MMGSGYWLNCNDRRLVEVESHDVWIRNKENADSIGILKWLYDKIMQYPSSAVDEIRLLALYGGLVRIREHPRYTSIQFANYHPHQIQYTLTCVLETLIDLEVHPDTIIRMDNFLNGESAICSVSDLQDKKFIFLIIHAPHPFLVNIFKEANWVSKLNAGIE